jgi:hypothetical protein
MVRMDHSQKGSTISAMSDKNKSKDEFSSKLKEK